MRNTMQAALAVVMTKDGRSVTYTRKGMALYAKDAVARIRRANPGCGIDACDQPVASWWLRVVDGRCQLVVTLTSNITGRTYEETVAV